MHSIIHSPEDVESADLSTVSDKDSVGNRSAFSSGDFSSAVWFSATRHVVLLVLMVLDLIAGAFFF